mmetsp:Transcript_7962/g.18782  ORF Transcript_7962/g.18782 Transcript_7962/m.18782 type:complete len:166 (+) Transcript_7962:79-576(+)
MAELPEGVSWTQDEDSVEVTVLVPDETTRAMIMVKTTADELKVLVRKSERWTPMVTGKLAHKVERESCCWSVDKVGAGKGIVIQLEKKKTGSWDFLLRADVAGSILEELGREQVIVDAGADAASLVCALCGALVKASRMQAHSSLWCSALAHTATARDGSGSEND